MQSNYSLITQEKLLETIHAAQQGDLDAYEAIVSHYERMLFSHVYRMTQSREDTQDILQDTFVKVYVHLKKIDTEKSFHAWIFSIATHTAYDWLRKKQRRFEVSLPDDTDESVPLDVETISPYEAYISTGASLDIEKALSEIKPLYRTVLLLVYREGFTYEEVSDTLHVPLNTVKTYVHRARIAFKNMLEGKES